MANRKLTQEEIDAWRKMYEKDLAVIGDFLGQEKPEKTYRLFFRDGGQILAHFMGSCDSDNGLDVDDPYYEDLYVLDFKVLKVEKQRASHPFQVNQWLSLNYHNFFERFELVEENEREGD